VAYSFLKNDLFVFFANAPSLVLSIWLNMGAVKLQYREQFQSWQQATETVADSSLMLSSNQNEESNNTRETEQFNDDRLHADFAVVVNPAQSSFSSHEKWVLYIVTVWIIVLSYMGLSTSMSREQQTNMIGLVVNANLVFFYAGPLATVATVFRERSSSTLHIPTVGMTVTNTSFWMAYGFVIFDPYIIIPNGIGFMLGLIQLSLCLLFPRHKSDAPEMQLISGHDENEEYRDEPVIT
jgi:solute carrier family 50 protein (sugar transporter)